MAEGFKAWTGGQVLNAQDLTDYASSQAVMRFANAAGRDAALTVSVVQEGMLAYLKDTNTLTVNTNGLTTGWAQIYPVITATISDSQVTNAKLAANSVSSSNIIDGTIVGGDIATGTITGANIQNGSIGAEELVSGGTYPIAISGNAATASNSSQLNGYSSATSGTANTIVRRDGAGSTFLQTGAMSYLRVASGSGAVRDGTTIPATIDQIFDEALNGIPYFQGTNYLGSIDWYINAIGDYINASDRTLKENIEDADATKYAEGIDGLRLRTFNLIGRAGDRVGFIAQEVQETLPEAVVENNGKLGLDYNVIVAALVAKVQQLETRLEALETH
jgi:hypothetical protein